MSDATQPGATAFTCKTKQAQFQMSIMIVSFEMSLFFLVGSANWPCVYVPAAVLPGHGFGQSDHPGLGGAVVGLPDVAYDPCH